MSKTALLTALVTFLSFIGIHSQEFPTKPVIGLFTGLMNYQGDLKPNSFTFQHSNFTTAIIIRKPINRWVSVRAGFQIGKLEGADRYNRDYLKKRNLSFNTSIKELHAALELSLLDLSDKRFTPYFYGGLAVFHFNPWTNDKNGKKVYLNPLSTEGQGLAQYPKQKIYRLTQLVMPFGGGVRMAISDNVNISLEFSQRKSFTDYIDDVSTHYVKKEILMAARGSRAAELAYRGHEIPGGVEDYPADGEQRGTPSEMDWYYFFGTTIEIKFSALPYIFKSRDHHIVSYQQRCPRRVVY